MTHRDAFGDPALAHRPGPSSLSATTGAPVRGGPSPWGPMEHVGRTNAAGVWCIYTASHGGFYVAPHRREEIPAAWRAYAQRRAKGWGPGWFEEDVAAGAVVLSFPELSREWGPEYLDNLRSMLNFYIPEYLDNWTARER